MERPTGRRDRAGFTLLELMIVIVILGILASYTIPDMGGWTADSRIRRAAAEVLATARRAQSQAMSEGVTFTIVYEEASLGGHGTLRAYRGMTNRCTQGQWAQAVTVHGEDGPWLDMRYYNPSGTAPSVSDSNRHVIQLDVYFAGNAVLQKNVAICYEPSGRIYTTAPGNAAPGVPALFPQTLDIFFEVHGDYNGVSKGVTRQVVFPAGGLPRIHQGVRG